MNFGPVLLACWRSWLHACITPKLSGVLQMGRKMTSDPVLRSILENAHVDVQRLLAVLALICMLWACRSLATQHMRG